MKQLLKKRVAGITICLTLLASGSAAGLSAQPGVSAPGATAPAASSSTQATPASGESQAPANTSDNLSSTPEAIPLAPVDSTRSITILIIIIFVTVFGGSVWAGVKLRRTAKRG